MARLQIGIQTTKPMASRLTPIDRGGLPKNVEDAARLLIAWIDKGDVQPGDGEADFAVDQEVHLPILGNVDVEGTIFLKLRDDK